MADHRHKLKMTTRVPGYDKDACIYQCKVKDCPHTETRFSRGTRRPKRKRGKK
jgi:hypothetical protein